jgi:starch-binding outer membrane protein, SusD/RagB family
MTQQIQYIARFGKILLACLSLAASFSGCKKYLEVPLPQDRITVSTVFQNDNTAAAVLTGIYGKLFSQHDFDGNLGIGCFTGLYTDELKNQTIVIPNFQIAYADAVSGADGIATVTAFWSNFYGQLYSVNLAIENLKSASGLNHARQWLGEAYFLRGFLYFYLTNLYGDAPLVLGSDYLVNNSLARSPQADVYKQIVGDLLQAQSLLESKYHDATGAETIDRGRPNRTAATALLARVYLYTHDWANAQAMAGNLISDRADFQLTSLSNTFLVNSTETIWGLKPFKTGYPYLVDDVGWILPAGTTPDAAFVSVSMSDSLAAAFEPGDARYSTWVGKDTVAATGTTPKTIYYFPYKYKANGNYTTAQEMVALFRLAEQYLIRAEAKAQQNDLAAAAADLNTIRARAGLAPTTASTQSTLLAAILRERRVELFTESGQRLFDLRRTGNLDAVMAIAAPAKGGTWSPYKAWWPISLTDIQSDTHLTQTPGYP